MLNMNNTVNTDKENVMRLLALAGVIAAIVVIAWLTILFVSWAPTGFSQLASLADDIANYEDSLDEEEVPMEEPTTLVLNTPDPLQSGQATVLSWEPVNQPGTYTFVYDCKDGVALQAAYINNEPQTLECDEIYNIGEETSLEVEFVSEAEAADIGYTVTFTPRDTAAEKLASTSIITVVNNDVLAVADEEVVEEEETTTTTTPPAPTTTHTPTVKYVYQIPQSDPRGHTDLAIRFLNVGSIHNGQFKSGNLTREEAGAIQFEIKNTGTKTSTAWDYTITLPNGDTHRSPLQTPLKPNERSIVTLGFTTKDINSHYFTAHIDSGADSNSTNNSFYKQVSVSR